MIVPTKARPAYNLNELRDLLAVTRQGIAYLNHAGMSPLPAPAAARMIAAVEAMQREGAGVYATIVEPAIEELLTNIGRLVNAAPDEIALMPNTAAGLNTIAQSLPLHPGDEVLLCDVEFPSNVYPWQNLARRGISTRLIPAREGGLSLEEIEANLTPRSRVLAVSAVQFFTGRREDLHALGHCCAQHGMWLVVDAMQAAGIVPIDMQEMGIHALAAGGQKALMGPPGQGFMVIRRDLAEQMTPVFVGPLSVENWEHWLAYGMTPRPGARRFDLATVNVPGIVGLNESIKLLLGLGIDHIAEWVTTLSSLLIEDLEQRGWRIITPHDPARRANIVTFAWQGDAKAAVARLKEQGVILTAHLDAVGNPHLRVSSHCYNTVQEVLRVGEAVEGLRHEQH
ncbi:MAG: aminotransferase class V-fold PLP-dependent enzyme [Anaerolineae bacterium]